MVQTIERDISWQRRQPGRATGHDVVVVSVLIVHDSIPGVLRADPEHRVVLGTEVATIWTGPPQPLAVAWHGGQHYVARQIMLPADAEVLAYRAHARMIARFGKIVLAVAAPGIPGHYCVRIDAVVAV